MNKWIAFASLGLGLYCVGLSAGSQSPSLAAEPNPAVPLESLATPRYIDEPTSQLFTPELSFHRPRYTHTLLASSDPSKSLFSGDRTDYVDDYNGFKLSVPDEFTLDTRGQTTNWLGPIIRGSGTVIYVNAAPIPGVDPQVLYDANIQQIQADRFYTEVEPVTTVMMGDRPVLAFRAKEVDTQRGTRDLKLPDDIHRWHLWVFGNDRMYTFGFGSSFQSFQDGDVQAIYDAAISSVELVPIVD